MTRAQDDALYAAVDLGASSGRVMLGGLAPGELMLREVRRFHYPMRKRGGHLRWDMDRILRETKEGLREAGVVARAMGRPIHSIGVDTWAVDYGLLDANGVLIEDPICYRDDRTVHTMPEVFRVVPRAEIFRRTGIQFMVFNTIFQLFEHQRHGLPSLARKMLLIPDLIHQALCGSQVTEYSNASTTQLFDPRTGNWDRDLIGRLGLPQELFPEIVQSGTDLGPLRPELAEELELPGVHVVAVATHDTGSAVAGAPLREGWAYISSGTWSLVGIELSAPLINAEVARENFTNEGGAYGTIRFLKNCMGLWLFESCKKQWEQQGLWVDYQSFLLQVSAIAESPGLVFPDDQSLFNPANMVEALADQMRATSQTAPTDPVAMTKIILDSLALRCARIIEIIERLSGKPIEGVQIVGGGSRNEYLSQATANAVGKPVLSGPAEATATGNLLVQAVAGGRFESLERGRAHVNENSAQRRFEPRDADTWRALKARYRAIEDQLLPAPAAGER